MEKIYLLQVRGTYHEVSANSVSELQTKATVMRDKHNLSRKSYRIFIGRRPNGSREFFKFGKFVKEDKFS